MAKKLTKLQKEIRAMKSKLPLGKAPLRKKTEDKSVPQLMSPQGAGTAWHSKYVRLRDSSWNGSSFVGKCITCDRELVVWADGRWLTGAQNGHYISRGVYSLFFEEYNTNLQCSNCNAWRDKKDMIHAYEEALAMKYGDEIPKELYRLSKLPDAKKRPTKEEVLQVIADAKEYINYTLSHESHN